MFVSSAPGESPPPLPGSTHGAVSDIHNDITKTRAIVSDIRRAVLENQESSKHPALVSDSRTIIVAEWPLNVAQTQTRSAISTANDPIILHLNTAYLENLRPYRQGPSSAATS